MYPFKDFSSALLAVNRQTVFVFCIAMLSLCSLAQEANVLGLPAVPQARPNAVDGSTKASSSPKAPAGTPAGAPSRDVLAGEMGLQHSALNGLGRLIVTTRVTFATAGAQSSAIDAARSVQRELSKSCLKQCVPQKMGSPKILSSGQLEFELAFRPLYQHLNQAQFIAALQSKPLNLTPAQITAPIPAQPSISVSMTTSGTPSAGTETK